MPSKQEKLLSCIVSDNLKWYLRMSSSQWPDSLTVNGYCEDHIFPFTAGLDEQGSQVSDRLFKVYFYKDNFGEVVLYYSDAAGVLSNHTVGAQDSNIQEATVLAQ